MVILPKGYLKDLRDIPEEIKQHMAFTFVSTMDEVLTHCLLNKAVPPVPADQVVPDKPVGTPVATVAVPTSP